MKRFRFSALCCAVCILCVITPPNSIALSQQNSQEEELFFISQKAFDDGFYDVAIRYIEQFLQKFPSTKYYSKAHLLYGQCYFYKNQYLKAFDIFQSLLNEPSLQDATLYWMGETYFKGSDYRQAQAYYKKIIKNHPESEYIPQAYYSLGWSFFEQGNYENAIIYFHNIIDKFSTHTLSEDALFKIGESYLSTSQYTNSINTFEQYIRQYPKFEQLPNAFFYLAESYYYNNNFLEANTYYAKASEHSRNPHISYMSEIGMGWIYLKLQKFSLAERHFYEAGILARKNNFSIEEILLGEGSLYTEIEQYTQAIKKYDEFLNLFPKNPRILDAMLGKANALYLLQKYDDSIKAYKNIINNTKDQPSSDIIQKIYYGIAWSYLKQGKFNDAIQAFKIIVDQTDNAVVKASALSQIGDAYQEAEKLTQALSIYDKILNEYAESLYADYAQFQQGITLLKLDRTESAKSSFQSLKSNFPNSNYLNEVDYYLGFAHFQNQEWTESIHYVESFLKNTNQKKSFSTQATYILALAYFHQTNYKKSLKLFKKVVNETLTQPSIQQTAEIFIGKSLFQLNRNNEAIKHFRQICQLYPSTEAHQDALLWLGSYHLEQFDFENAILFYNTFIEKFSDNDKVNIAYYELGQAYQAEGAFDKALNIFKNVLPTADPEIFAKSQLSIADIFAKKIGSQKALDTYRKISNEVPSYRRDALIKIAKIYEEGDSPKKAITIYQEALNSKQLLSEISNEELYFAIADNYELLNNKDKAIEEYLRIPYLTGEKTIWAIKSYLRIARIFEDNESWDQAEKTYEKIFNLNVEESKYAEERIEWINNNTK